MSYPGIFSVWFHFNQNRADLHDFYTKYAEEYRYVPPLKKFAYDYFDWESEIVSGNIQDQDREKMKRQTISEKSV